jgi:hypothetical protein
MKLKSLAFCINSTIGFSGFAFGQCASDAAGTAFDG